MNIFVLDTDPILAAQAECDKHVVKMPVETAQLLCSVFTSGQAPYKRCFYNHPCAVWARKSKQNYDWLVRHGLALCDEYTYRYVKIHKCRSVIEWCRDNITDLPDLGLTPFAQCVLEENKNQDVVKAYRDYYIAAKRDLLTYTKRRPPIWIPDGLVKWKEKL